MRQAAALRAINRRALLVYLAALAGLMIAAALAVMLLQRQYLRNETREDLQTEMTLLGEIATDALLRSDYAAVEALTQRWLDKHAYITHITAVMPNGFVLADTGKVGAAAEPLIVRREVAYEGRPLLTLHAVGDFSVAEKGFSEILLRVSLVAAIMVLLVGWLLWRTLHRTAIRPLELHIRQREARERKLVKRGAELLAARDEAERASQAKSEFLSRMSHELRTPMNAILGFSQLLESEPLAPQHRSFVDEIRQAGNHLLALIDELLDLSRIGAGKLDVSLETLELRTILDQAVHMVSVLVQEKRLTLSRECGAVAMVYADATRLRQILVNLLSNAAKYNREGGAIAIRCQPLDGQRVRISIADTGKGIAAEKLPLLFNPFERIGAEYSGVDGAGIGLALSKRLAILMRGDIGVESALGEGSAFWLDLPAAPADRIAVAEPFPTP
jgi:signal transduction histidine kinase